MTAKFNEVPELDFGGSYKVTNAWTGKSMGCKSGSVAVDLDAHDTAVLVVQDSCDNS